MNKLDLIREAQQRRKSSIEEPSLDEVGKMIHDIDFLLGQVDVLIENSIRMNRLLNAVASSTDFEYSAVEDLGG